MHVTNTWMNMLSRQLLATWTISLFGNPDITWIDNDLSHCEINISRGSVCEDVQMAGSKWCIIHGSFIHLFILLQKFIHDSPLVGSHRSARRPYLMQTLWLTLELNTLSSVINNNLQFVGYLSWNFVYWQMILKCCDI